MTMSRLDLIKTEYIPVGKMLGGKSFSNLDKIKKLSSHIVRQRRDEWLLAVFIKHSIFANPAVMSRRELFEIFEKNQVTLVDEDGIYRIYKDNKVIGEWQNKTRWRLTKDGMLQVKIKYVIV
jgi:hypothetical protein